MAVIVVCQLGPTRALQAAGRSKRDGVLRNVTAQQVRVIVRTRPGARTTIKTKLRQRGNTIHADHPFINAFTATVDRASLSVLDADGAVESLSLDAPVSGVATAVTGTTSINTLLPTLGLPSGTLSGRGVGVCVIDSGLETVPTSTAGSAISATSRRRRRSLRTTIMVMARTSPA
jgi:hypothetical protein